MNANDHPGEPLSRAERVLLSNLKNETYRARVIVERLRRVIGAIPGSQKIETAQVMAVRGIDALLEAFKLRKQGAPLSDEPPARPPSPSVDAAPIEDQSLRLTPKPCGNVQRHCSMCAMCLHCGWLLADHAPPAPPIPPAVTEKEVMPSEPRGSDQDERWNVGDSATPGVVLKEGTAPAHLNGRSRCDAGEMRCPVCDAAPAPAVSETRELTEEKP